MVLKLTEALVWFKSLGLFKMILFGAAILITTVGLLGFMIFYSLWRSRYYWIFNDDSKSFRESCDKASSFTTSSLCSFYDKLKSDIPLALALCVVGIVLFIVTALLWLLLEKGIFWKISLWIAILASLVAAIIGVDLWVAVASPDTFTKEGVEYEYKPCLDIESSDLSIRAAAGKIKSSDLQKETDTTKKYCEDSVPTNAAFILIIIIGLILDVVAFFLLK